MRPEDLALQAHVAGKSTARSGEIDVLGYQAKRFRKTYPRLPRIDLPRPSFPARYIGDILSYRRSIRSFGIKPVPLAMLAGILELSVRERMGCDTTSIRPYPSAGSLYPTELYLVALRSDGIDPGLYHYDGYKHELRMLGGYSVSQDCARSLFIEKNEDAPCYIILTSVFYRSMQKYGARGYRFALIEIGSIAQNLTLAASTFGLGSYFIGGFDDDALAEALDISWDLELEAPVLVIAIGFPAGTDGN